MALFKLGKTPKPKGFNFIPRYYDPVKEEFSNRTKKYDGDVDLTEIAKDKIKLGFRSSSRFNQKEVSKTNGAAVNKRLLYIIIILLFVTYMILKSDTVLRILQSMSGNVQNN